MCWEYACTYTLRTCIIYAPACECSLFVWCTRVYTVFAHSVHTCTHTMCTTSTYCLSHVCAWCARSVHGVHVQCMVCTFSAWCARSVHGVHVLCMVCTFCAWCARFVNGCNLSISTSQARFQPLYIYMYIYIEVAVCHFNYYPTTSV